MIVNSFFSIFIRVISSIHRLHHRNNSNIDTTLQIYAVTSRKKVISNNEINPCILRMCTQLTSLDSNYSLHNSNHNSTHFSGKQQDMAVVPWQVLHLLALRPSVGNSLQAYTSTQPSSSDADYTHTRRLLSRHDRSIWRRAVIIRRC